MRFIFVELTSTGLRLRLKPWRKILPLNKFVTSNFLFSFFCVLAEFFFYYYYYSEFQFGRGFLGITRFIERFINGLI
jgi:hypothetical protein